MQYPWNICTLILGKIKCVLQLTCGLKNAEDLDAILDECEDIGYRAGGFAVRAACAIMISNCPVPFIEEDDDFGSRSALADGMVIFLALNIFKV